MWLLSQFLLNSCWIPLNCAELRWAPVESLLEFNGFQQSSTNWKMKSVKFRWTPSNSEVRWTSDETDIGSTEFSEIRRSWTWSSTNMQWSSTNLQRSSSSWNKRVTFNKSSNSKLWSSNFYIFVELGVSLTAIQRTFNELQNKKRFIRSPLNFRWTLLNSVELLLNRFWSSTEFIELATGFNELATGFNELQPALHDFLGNKWAKMGMISQNYRIFWPIYANFIPLK